jgi:hypothetical protein
MYKELEQYMKSHGKLGQKELQQITACFKPIKTTRNQMLCNTWSSMQTFLFYQKRLFKTL